MKPTKILLLLLGIVLIGSCAKERLSDNGENFETKAESNLIDDGSTIQFIGDGCTRRDVSLADLAGPRMEDQLFTPASLKGELDRLVICGNPSFPCNFSVFDPPGAPVVLQEQIVGKYCTKIFNPSCPDLSPIVPTTFTVAMQDQLLAEARDIVEANLPCEPVPGQQYYTRLDFYVEQVNCSECAKPSCIGFPSCGPTYNYIVGVDISILCCPS